MSNIRRIETNNKVRYQGVFDFYYEDERGLQKRKRICKTFDKKAQAKRFISEMEREHENNKTVVKYDVTFQDFFENVYMKDYWNNLAPTTKQEYERLYRSDVPHALKNYWGKTKLCKITKQNVQHYVNFLSERMTPKSCKTFIHLLGGTLRLAKRLDYINSFPLDDVILPKSVKNDITVYTPEEIKKIWEYTAQDKTVRLIFGLACLCGLRRSEIGGLQYSSVHTSGDESFIEIKQARHTIKGKNVVCDTKTVSSHRIVPLTPIMKETLKQARVEYLENKLRNRNFTDSDFVLSKSNGEPYTINGLSNRYDRFIRKLADKGIPYKSLHKCRHAFCTNLITNNVDVVTVSHLAGHSQTSTTTDIYSHSVKAVAEKSVNKLDEIIFGQNSGMKRTG